MGELNHRAAGYQNAPEHLEQSVTQAQPGLTFHLFSAPPSKLASFSLFFRLVFSAFVRSRLLHLYIHSIAVAFEPDWAGIVLGTREIVVTKKCLPWGSSCTCGVEKVAEQTYEQIIYKVVLTVIENNNQHKRLAALSGCSDSGGVLFHKSGQGKSSTVWLYLNKPWS